MNFKIAQVKPNAARMPEFLYHFCLINTYSIQFYSFHLKETCKHEFSNSWKQDVKIITK